MRPGKRRALPNTPEGRLQDLIEAAKAHVRAKVEQPIPGYQTAVRIPGNRAARPGQEQLQD